MNSSPTHRPFAALALLAMLLTLAIGCQTDPPIEPDTSSGAAAAKSDNLDAEADRYVSQVDQAVAQTGRAAERDVRWLPLGAGQVDRASPTPPPADPARRQPTVDTRDTFPAAAVDDPPDPAPDVDPASQPDAELTRRELVRRLAWTLAADSRAGDESLRPYLARAALSLADPRQELSEADLLRLSPDRRRLVLAYQRTFSQLARSLGASDGDDRQLLRDAAEELVGQLDAWKKLTLRKLRLCRRVDGYGTYQTFGSHTFLAGRAHPMIVYAELDHFAVQPQADGQNLVHLTQEMVLFNESDGLPVWRQRPVTIKDQSLNRRRDFFVVQVITLSDRLTVGKYLLKVTITDEIGQAVDEATVPIQIVADPNLAGR